MRKLKRLKTPNQSFYDTYSFFAAFSVDLGKQYNGPDTLVSPHGGLDTDQNKVLTYVSNLPRSGDLRHIEWDSQGPVDQNGNITITLPNENGGQPIIFKVIAADYASPVEYSLLGKSPEGEIALYVTLEGTGGTIDLVTTSYYLYPLGNAKGLLIEKSPLAAENGTCGTDNTNPENNEDINFCEDDCGSAMLDVLAMVTPQANQWITDNFGVFGQWFLFVETHNINLAFANSAVFNKRVRVRIINYTPNFLLTNNMVTDLNALSANADAQLTLQQSGADVGILLTNQNYGEVFGRANSLDPFSTNKFCIAQVAFINPIRYTFAHELAHQFGCLHSNPLTTGCPHGFNMPNDRNTIMANDAPDNTRIQHFSNPDVLFAGQATGIDGTRNNAAQIRGAFCEVANNNTPVIFSAHFEHEQFVCENSPFWASGISEGAFQVNFWGLLEECQGPYTYQWSWSTHPDFTVSYNIGTNSPWLTLDEPPHCPQFYLRLTISSAGVCPTTTSTKLINCHPGPCERRSNLPMANVEPANRVIPNPAYDRITVLSEGVGEIKRLSLLNYTGIIREIYPMSMSGEREITLNISDLSPGIWFVHIQGSEKNQTLRFAVVR